MRHNFFKRELNENVFLHECLIVIRHTITCILHMTFFAVQSSKVQNNKNINELLIIINSTFVR